MNEYRYIRNALSEEDILTKLAEEASELAQAALKLNRVKKTNPNSIDAETALSSLHEEVTDIMVTLAVFLVSDPDDSIESAMETKAARWCEQLKQKKCEEVSVVRCKDCKYFSANAPSEGICKFWSAMSKCSRIVGNEDYCSNGEVDEE